jgi:DNA-binding NtrC family response regulator
MNAIENGMLETIRCFVNRWQRGRSFGRSKPAQYSAATEKISVLAITSDDRDRRSLSTFSLRGQWDLAFASSCQEALDSLKSSRAAVIMCARDLPGPDWRNCLEILAAARPECPILLISSIYDEYLWEEVVHRGGYDVLRKPLEEEQAVRAVNLAWSYSKTGWRVPTHRFL